MAVQPRNLEAAAHAHRIAVPRPLRGFALIEAIIAIVVVAAAGAVILGQVSLAESQSARQLRRTEAAAIAAAYVAEIGGRPFADPDGSSGETLRGAFDDIDDYAGLSDNGARTARGTLIPGLQRYTVRVQVARTNRLPGVPAADARRITVTVTDPGTGETAVATRYRTRP